MQRIFRRKRIGVEKIMFARARAGEIVNIYFQTIKQVTLDDVFSDLSLERSFLRVPLSGTSRRPLQSLIQHPGSGTLTPGAAVKLKDRGSFSHFLQTKEEIPVVVRALWHLTYLVIFSSESNEVSRGTNSSSDSQSDNLGLVLRVAVLRVAVLPVGIVLCVAVISVGIITEGDLRICTSIRKT